MRRTLPYGRGSAWGRRGLRLGKLNDYGMITDDRDTQIAQLEEELAELRARERDLADFLENASLGLHSVGPDGRILWGGYDAIYYWNNGFGS